MKKQNYILVLAYILSIKLSYIHTNNNNNNNNNNNHNNYNGILPRNFMEAYYRKADIARNMKQIKLEPMEYMSNKNDIWNLIEEIIEKFSNMNQMYSEMHSTLPNVTKACLLNVAEFIVALKEKQLWALKVIDSFGKPPAGLLEGNFFWVGEFSECTSINVSSSDWQSEFCTLSKPPNANQSTLPFIYGICVPNKCTNDDIAGLVNYVFSIISANISSIFPIKFQDIDSSYVKCHGDKPLYTSGIVAICILGLIVLLVGIGTTYDVIKQYRRHIKLQSIIDSKIYVTEDNVEKFLNLNDRAKLIALQEDEMEPTSLKILCSFSAYTNIKKIFNLNVNKDQLHCLHAIRYLSSGWVILGHTYYFGASIVDNPLKESDWLRRFSFLLVSNALFSVDTFFLLSGLLTCYMFMKEVNKPNVKLSFGFMIKYYLHRLWRLTPTYMIVLMFNAVLTRYLGNGPFYPDDGFEINMCKNTWWTNLLYINNFVHTDELCVGVSWYLANDMQYHWISPLILIPLMLGKRRIAFLISSLLLILSFLSIGLILNGYPGAEAAQFATQNAQAYMENIYIKPWARIGPFIVGLIIGYIIFLHKKNSITIKIPKALNMLGWLISLFLCSILIFGLYPDASGKPLSRITHIMYQCFSRTAWAIALGYIILACVTNHGGIVNKILSWPIWLPLSRLTYSAFLVHATIMTYFYVTLEHPLHLQDVLMAYFFVAQLFLSYFFALFISIFCEIPIIGLEKFIFG